MRLRPFPLLACFALAACQGLHPPPDLAGRPHATIVGSHVDGDDRVQSFRVTAIDGWPVNRPADQNQDLDRLYATDTSNALAVGHPVRVEFEGRLHYRNAMRNFFWDAAPVDGSVEFVPVADARYVVRGAIGAEGSSVWLEDERTHELVGQRFAAGPRPAASIPDMRSRAPDLR